jgi:hypothetical protein
VRVDPANISKGSKLRECEEDVNNLVKRRIRKRLA